MPQAKKLLEIFRPGTFVSVEGAKLTFSAADVAATVAAYDVAKHKAPLVIGHPRMDDPAYGHAVSLSLGSKNVVLAEPANVDPAFADAVNNERYDSISASFWSPTNPRNPVPGVYYLRHIGFLGAVPPAVPGLKQPSFADADDADLITINFADNKQEPAMGTPTQAELDKQKLEADQASFADQQAAAKKREDELAAREKALAAKEAKAREDEINSFAEGLIKSGKLLPVEKTGIVAVLGALPADQAVSFADGDGKTVSQPTADVLRDFLSKLPPRVDFAEHSARENNDDTQQTSSFAAPNGFSVDPKQLELHNKIQAHADKHNISYAQAAAVVRA